MDDDTVARLDSLLSSFDEYRILSYDSARLVLIGCWDLTYHHSVEVEFKEVAFIHCATYFFAQRFRLGTAEERNTIRRMADIDENEKLYCFESDSRTYFIVAENVVIREGLVSHTAA